jgi:ribosomal protein S18 acetylase RimI-like enzyme
MNAGSGDPVEHVDVVDEKQLPDGRRLIVREGRVGDTDDLNALYRRLSGDDLWLRFFTAAAPAPTFFDHWLSIADEGGLVLVVLVEERSGRTTLVAEAGYSLLEDGDGELGITVDPSWRGWLGPWLLAVLLREAAARGVPNLQAVVQVSNRAMMSTLRRHGAAIVEQPEPNEIRLAIGTSGGTPGWPVSHDKPRILVEAAYGHWAGERAAREAGFEIRTCRGPGTDRQCPMLAGEGCPLVEGADVVVSQFPDEAPYTAAIVDELRRHPDLHLVLPAFGSAGPDSCESAETVIDQICRALGATPEGV